MQVNNVYVYVFLINFENFYDTLTQIMFWCLWSVKSTQLISFSSFTYFKWCCYWTVKYFLCRLCWCLKLGQIGTNTSWLDQHSSPVDFLEVYLYPFFTTEFVCVIESFIDASWYHCSLLNQTGPLSLTGHHLQGGGRYNLATCRMSSKQN